MNNAVLVILLCQSIAILCLIIEVNRIGDRVQLLNRLLSTSVLLTVDEFFFPVRRKSSRKFHPED